MDLVRWERQIEILFGRWGFVDTLFWMYAAIIIACILLLIEFIIGGMLVAGYRSRSASLVSIFLLSGFLAITAWEVLFDLGQSCGCFGALIRRTPESAVVEDLIFLVLAITAFLGSDKSATKQRAWFTLVIGGAGIIWTAVFTVFPPSSAVIRTGSTWFQQADEVEISVNNQLLWFFDPECSDCCDQLAELEKLMHDTRLPLMSGLTNATTGRIHEFVWDYVPSFQIKRITNSEFEHVFLPVGSLILVVDGRVMKIWRPKRMPTSAEEILVRI